MGVEELLISHLWIWWSAVSIFMFMIAAFLNVPSSSWGYKKPNEEEDTKLIRNIGVEDFSFREVHVRRCYRSMQLPVSSLNHRVRIRFIFLVIFNFPIDDFQSGKTPSPDYHILAITPHRFPFNLEFSLLQPKIWFADFHSIRLITKYHWQQDWVRKYPQLFHPLGFGRFQFPIRSNSMNVNGFHFVLAPFQSLSIYSVLESIFTHPFPVLL